MPRRKMDAAALRRQVLDAARRALAAGERPTTENCRKRGARGTTADVARARRDLVESGEIVMPPPVYRWRPDPGPAAARIPRSADPSTSPVAAEIRAGKAAPSDPGYAGTLLADCRAVSREMADRGELPRSGNAYFEAVLARRTARREAARREGRARRGA